MYLRCESITGFGQPKPIISSDNPFGPYFDLSLVWGPIRGREFMREGCGPNINFATRKVKEQRK